VASSPGGHSRSHSSRKLLAPAASRTFSFATGAVTAVPVRRVSYLVSGLLVLAPPLVDFRPSGGLLMPLGILFW